MSTAAGPTCRRIWWRPDTARRSAQPTANCEFVKIGCPRGASMDRYTVPAGSRVLLHLRADYALAIAAIHGRQLPAAETGLLRDKRGSNERQERDDMTDTQVTWLTQEAYDRLKARARPADRQPAGHRRRDQRPPRGGRPAGERRLPRRPRGAGPAGGPHPSAAGAAEQRQGRRGAQAVRCRAARLGRQGLLRRRRVRHRDVPDRHPPGGRQRRQARGVLARTLRWAAR